jgi:hypothetical protein
MGVQLNSVIKSNLAFAQNILQPTPACFQLIVRQRVELLALYAIGHGHDLADHHFAHLFCDRKLFLHGRTSCMANASGQLSLKRFKNTSTAAQSAINPCPIMQTNCKQKTPVKVAHGRRKKPGKRMPRFYALTGQARRLTSAGSTSADAMPNSND